MIDGGVFATGSFLTYKWHEVTKYIINHQIFPCQNNSILINLNKWNEIPPHLQNLIKDIAVKLEPDAMDFYTKERRTGSYRRDRSSVVLPRDFQSNHDESRH